MSETSPDTRMFPHSRAHILNDEERLARLSEETVLRLLDLTGREDVADLGSGTGFYTNRVAANTSGTVYAVEVQPEMQQHHRERGVPPNVRLVLGDLNQLPLPPDSLDRALSINTFHEAHEASGLSLLARALRPDGKFVIIDWCKSPAAAEHGPPLQHRLTLEQAEELLSPYFQILHREELEPFLFVLIASPGPAQKAQEHPADALEQERQSSNVGGTMVSDRIGVNLTRHIYERQQRDFPRATGELSGILNQIALAAKVISREVTKAGLVEILGFTGDVNVHGEPVRRLDQYANDVLVSAFHTLGNFCVLGTEESDEFIAIPEEDSPGHYSIAFDPLDGSSNIDVNISVGTIFGVHRKVTPEDACGVEDLLQPGRTLVAAGYVVYGSSTMLVMSDGDGVHGFTLDPSVGEFLLSHPYMKMPKSGRIYSTNDGNYCYWSEGVKKYIDSLKSPEAVGGKPYSSRYVGSLVADFHRTLIYGGIFLYPADTKDPKRPSGKLRLLYECAPLAFLAEHAGGAASDGHRPILDIVPTELHQRVPFFVGSVENVRELEEYIARYDNA